ncbi:hypothetical protein [Actinoplanes xinjiangensis]|jgi:hypothetical protein|uniref:Uncharacterized protein n=1 Tax=Actinoplanes xinjiangensis TaxID=512350 RepID=A0A316FAG5_9ACTN|nr:hypothetical protein [Actinoplanes xinjiangensis]PWK45255.1 hypothetical protein BC793_111229 [Actinoplanes xinjiangensis]GIF41410.1 hypothetical protein Axi01nite_57210 [Actinoplanes xinjiangensis]
MTAESWDDDAMLHELAAAVRDAGHLTGRVRTAGTAAWTWRGIDEEWELASLTYDSLIDAGPAVRAADAGRTVLFTGDTAEVQVERDGELLVGQVIPPAPGRLTAEGAQGHRTESEVDEVGCFSVALPAGEPVRLRVNAGAARLVTDWIRM